MVDIRISSNAYFWLVYLFMGIIVWIATKRLFRDLRAQAKIASIATLETEKVENVTISRTEHLFRYSVYFSISITVLATACFVGPFIADTPDKPIKVAGYIFTFIFCGIPTALYAIYCFRYSICVDECTIKIRGFTKRIYSINEIEKMDVQRGKAGYYLIVVLSSGQSLIFPGMLKNFDVLVNTLKQIARKE